MEKPYDYRGDDDMRLHERLGVFMNVLNAQAAEPPAHDERIGAYAEALGQELDRPGPMQDFFRELLQAHPDFGTSHLATKTLRAAQSQLYGNFSGYPKTFLTPQQWHEGFAWIFDDFDRLGQFTVDIWARPLQSNVSERYKGLKAFGVLARQMGRLGLFSVMDVGCSQNAGLKHMASGLGFELPTLIRPGSYRRLPSVPIPPLFILCFRVTCPSAQALV